VTAPVHPGDDPQHDAESSGGAPETAEESARARELARLFGHTEEDAAQRSAAEEAASRDSLAALFARPANAPSAAPVPDFAWDPEAAVVPEAVTDAAPLSAAAIEVDAADAAPVSARARRAAARASHAASAEEKTDVAPAAPVSAAAAGAVVFEELVSGGAVDRSTAAESVADSEVDVPEPDTDLHDADPLAWLGFTDEAAPATASSAVAEPDVTASATPVAARASWLDVVGGEAETKTALPAAVAAGALAAPTGGVLAAEAPAGSFFPVERRGIRGWSSRVRWSVAVSIVLLIGVVAGSVVIAQNIAANNLAAQELAAAIAELEAAEASAADPQPLLDEAVSQYDDTVATAQATADSAAPPLAAVAGMAAQPVLDASNAALAALVAQLAVTPPDDLPEPYARGDVDMTDIDEVKAATKTADNHVELLTTATREVRAAQTALQEKIDALRTAQVALGASLPETAVLIVGENKRALQSFRDAVIAASIAVPAAQNAGGSGDAELLAYAAAVTALRTDQTRAETGVTPVTPPTTNPAPAPEPVPEPPAPVETTPPAPLPTDTPTPTPTP
jgi:hypothetical protein